MVVITTLFWMLTWLPQIMSAVSEPPQPVNLTLNSSRLVHKLKWQPGPGTPSAVHYSVTVNTNKGTSWVPVTGCERVWHPLVCDLTDALPDLREVYLVQVTAWLDTQASQAATYPEFVPIKNTYLDPPLLTVTPCGRNLCVDLQPPMEHLRQAYDTLSYKLKVKSNSADGTQFFKDTKSLRGQVLEDLAPGREYCVSVCFSDSLESKESTYSQPVCAYILGIYSADPWIAALLCSSMMVGVVVFGLLVSTGFICLRKRPVPLVLTSVPHLDRVLVLAPCRMSLLNVKAALPPAGEKRSFQSSSDESDEEAGTERTGESRGGYTLRAGTKILSSSSSSSSSLSAPLSPKLELQPSSSSSQTPDFFSPLQPEVQVPTEIHSMHTLTTHTDIHSLTVGPVQTDMEGGRHSQDVNLLTLTFGRHEEQEDEVEEVNIGQPSLNWDDKEVAIEAVFHSPDEEDEEDEEQSGYMGRPCTDVLKNLL